MEENPYLSPPANPHPSVPARHSRAGIVCFAIAVTAGLVEAVMIPLSVYMAYSGVSNKSPAAILTGLVIVGALLLDLAALCLGIVGLFRRGRKRLLSVLGILISLAPPVALALMVWNHV